MSWIHRKLLISAKYNLYKLFLQQLQVLYYFSFLCSQYKAAWKAFRKPLLSRKMPVRNPCLDTFSWTVNRPELAISTLKKPKGFVQPTFPETPEGIIAIKVVVGILIPDQIHHGHRGRYSLKQKFVPKTPTGQLHTSSLPDRTGILYLPASIKPAKIS